MDISQLLVTSEAAVLCGKLFDAIDEDRSGFLDESECKTFLSCSGCERSELHIYWLHLREDADLDSDGRISKGEFLEYILSHEELDENGSFIDIDHKQHLQLQVRIMGGAGHLCGRLFDAADDDGTGYLEKAEGKIYLSSCGSLAEELDYLWIDLLRTADKNGDGRISKEEFLEYVLGDEELDESGGFVDREHERFLELQLRLLGDAGDLCGRLFDAIDDDSSGYLTGKEGKIFLSCSGCDVEELDSLWADLLRSTGRGDGDGRISRQGFLGYMLGSKELDESGGFVDKGYEKRLQINLRLMGNAGDLYGRLFDAIDDDLSGFLEEAEGKIFLAICGCESEDGGRVYLRNEGSEAEELHLFWRDVVEVADKDGDGKISKQEFLMYVLSTEELDESHDFMDQGHARHIEAQLDNMVESLDGSSRGAVEMDCAHTGRSFAHPAHQHQPVHQPVRKPSAPHVEAAPPLDSRAAATLAELQAHTAAGVGGRDSVVARASRAREAQPPATPVIALNASSLDQSRGRSGDRSADKGTRGAARPWEDEAGTPQHDGRRSPTRVRHVSGLEPEPVEVAPSPSRTSTYESNGSLDESQAGGRRFFDHLEAWMHVAEEVIEKHPGIESLKKRLGLLAYRNRDNLDELFAEFEPSGYGRLSPELFGYVVRTTFSIPVSKMDDRESLSRVVALLP